jgi:site-specific recombinase XerD
MNLIHAIDKFSAYLINEKNYSKHTLMNYIKDLNDLYSYIAKSQEDSKPKIELQYIDEATLKGFIAGFVMNREVKYSKRTISRKISTPKIVLQIPESQKTVYRKSFTQSCISQIREEPPYSH